MNTMTEATIEADPNGADHSASPATSRPRPSNCSGRTPTRSCSRSGSGPNSLQTRIDQWDARSGGSWRFVSIRDGEEFAFRGCFHEVRPDRIVQTFTYEGEPDGVALETLWFERPRRRPHPAAHPVPCGQLRGPGRVARAAAWRSGSTRATPSLQELLADGTV